MDQDDEQSAADIVNIASEEELQRIFREWGEERAAKAVARAILRERERGPITTTTALANVLERTIRRPPRSHKSRLHPATRTFQALRIAVNQELQHLAAFLEEGYQLLRPGGRMVILAYHSLEDRLVKEAFRRWAADCLCPPQLQICACGWKPQVKILTPKPLLPTEQEIFGNARARSARLRVIERCEGGG